MGMPPVGTMVRVGRYPPIASRRAHGFAAGRLDRAVEKLDPVLILHGRAFFAVGERGRGNQAEDGRNTGRHDHSTTHGSPPEIWPGG
jgi:hypothetical protein